MAIGEAGPGSVRHGAQPKRLEETMRVRLGRECVYVPSCRFGLYVALRHWCPPGGRVLMSPVNDDVIFFVVLAAGLRPVQAPLNPLDASIDIDAVPDEVWGSVSAVLTTNLYGNPDPAPRLRQKCDALGIPLFEDAAHAIGSRVGDRPVGAWGEASVFSLSKHVGAKAGGVLSLADPGLREAVEKTCAGLLAPRRTSAELAYLIRPYAEAAVRGLRLRRIGRGLDRLDDVLDACRAGTELLLSTPWAKPRDGSATQPLFRVPLFVADRDAAIAALARQGIVVGYLYDPPLDDYAGAEFTDPSPAPEAARWFARHALPVDPLRARTVVEVLERSGARPVQAPGELPGNEPTPGGLGQSRG
jgi:dTDP-4-amino-4,6-dideoxygalactose transaminase